MRVLSDDDLPQSARDDLAFAQFADGDLDRPQDHDWTPEQQAEFFEITEERR